MTNPKGRFGIHGGQYIPEPLMNAVIDRLDLPDIVYFIFLAVTFMAAVVIGLYIFLKDKKVNKI